MNCEEVSSKMISYLDEELTPYEREAVEKHLATCEHCMDEIRDLQEITRKISDTPMELPDESMKINFYHMLQTEINRQEQTTRRQPLRLSFAKIAAGLALLIGGTILGMFLQPLLKPGNSGSEMAQLKTEVQLMKEMVMMNMLNQESPSDRIKAVNYAEEIASPNNQVIDALLKTLNSDKNANVRMAAAYSLSKFTSRPGVMDSLIKSLEKQTDPIVQIVVMDILVQNRETRAIQPIQNIINDENTIQEVKDIAQKNMQVLL